MLFNKLKHVDGRYVLENGLFHSKNRELFMVQPIKDFLDDAEYDHLKDIFNEADQSMRSVCHALTPEEQHVVLKPRKGLGSMLHLLFEVLEERGLDVPTCPIENLKKLAHMEHQMQSLMNQLDTLHQLARDTYRLARGEVWDGFLNYYGVLTAMATRSQELKNRIRPLVEFMSNNARKSNTDGKNNTVDNTEDDE